MRVVLYFGTFNPIHVGHLIIANHMAQQPQIDQVWLVVTPHNPHKDKATLLSDQLRLDMVREAIYEHPNLKACDVEFHLPKPNYTISTLTHLQEQFPAHEFCLLMGADNLKSFHKWYNWEQILEKHQIFVYPRSSQAPENPEQIGQLQKHPNISMLTDVPILGISASHIRARLAVGLDCSYLLTEPVLEYILKGSLYHN
ncbi:MAG: nicotinate (nicotinamide) nucleotide adenylyltransferase [Sphingomonadales bacterium]